MKCLNVVRFGFLFIFLSISLFSQQIGKGSRTAIKEVIMRSNNVHFVSFNYGSVNKPNYLGNVADLYWNKLGYMFELGSLLAGEVAADNGETIRIVSDSHVLSSQGLYSPDLTTKWGWLPRHGFANPNQNEVANANNPDSWPLDWLSWYGETGWGKQITQNEAYYVMDDFSSIDIDVPLDWLIVESIMKNQNRIVIGAI